MVKMRCAGVEVAAQAAYDPQNKLWKFPGKLNLILYLQTKFITSNLLRFWSDLDLNNLGDSEAITES